MIAEVSTAARWVTAWGTSMQCRSSEPALGRPARTFCDQTLRMVIAPQIAGDSVRLRFSNRFQNDDVELDGVWVGSADGETAGAGDNRKVLFGSADRVTVLRGATAISDPVDLAISPWARLAVSFHVGPSLDPPMGPRSSRVPSKYLLSPSIILTKPAADASSTWTPAPLAADAASKASG